MALLSTARATAVSYERPRKNLTATVLSFQKLPEAVSILAQCILKVFQIWKTLNGSPWGWLLTDRLPRTGEGYRVKRFPAPGRHGCFKPQRGSLGTRAGMSLPEKAWRGL